MVLLESPKSQLSIEHNIVCFGGDLVTKKQEEYRGDEEITTHPTPEHLHVKPIMKTIGNELMEIWGKRGDNRDMATIKDPGMPPSRNLTEVVSGCCSGPSPPLVLLPEATQRWKQQGNGDS
ncbi:hypothetical protein BS47DRAFT_1386378 [Hydnum rufescens UP504]|uniref:Uncharacterized protein n=1 Tax=Hydnum rufescens UP504 TaxID=1448309 RepID=A0A9P6DM19_9AGAM|nr:hypothetical protein BS47DRAFT_1386378 [Hydnum rufescens UP504]